MAIKLAYMRARSMEALNKITRLKKTKAEKQYVHFSYNTYRTDLSGSGHLEDELYHQISDI